jgi:hypothetical protein
MISTLSLLLAETTDPDQQRSLIDDAGPIAGAFVLSLGIAIFFLWRSMSKQLKKIDPSLPSGRDDREQALDRQLTDEAVERGDADERGDAEKRGSADDAAGT